MEQPLRAVHPARVPAGPVRQRRGDAAVDEQCVPVDEAGRLGRQEDRCADQFFDLSPPARRRALFQPGAEIRVGDERGVERRIEIARRNRVALQPVTGPVGRHALGQVRHRALRGRVGRGAEQSYCILMTGHKLSQDSKTRLETMVRTNDGFEIAEVDLKLRGPGNIEGTQQSGVPFNLKIAHLGKDGQILQLARDTFLSSIEKK